MENKEASNGSVVVGHMESTSFVTIIIHRPAQGTCSEGTIKATNIDNDFIPFAGALDDL